MTPTTGCLILAVVSTSDLVGCCIGCFLVGMAVMGLLIVCHGNPRADQFEKELQIVTDIVCTALDQPHDEVPELDAIGHVRRMRDYLEVLRDSNDVLFNRRCERRQEVIGIQKQLDTTTTHNRDLQTKIAELESERRAYDLTVANCDHLRAENERLTSQLEAVGIKPAEVMAAEHDRIGCADSVSRLSEMSEPQKQAMLTFINSQLGIKQLGKPPRVRDDEAND